MSGDERSIRSIVVSIDTRGAAFGPDVYRGIADALRNAAKCLVPPPGDSMQVVHDTLGRPCGLMMIVGGTSDADLQPLRRSFCDC